MKKTLRLLLWEDCPKNCEGCCNKDFDLKNLPVIDYYYGFNEYDEIILTGGEPLLYMDRLISTIQHIKRLTDSKVYVYSSKLDDPYDLLEILVLSDGLTLTIRNPNDHYHFDKFNNLIVPYRKNERFQKKSLRLNAFNSLKGYLKDYSRWEIKKNIEWIKDCPLPENEIFMKLESDL